MATIYKHTYTKYNNSIKVEEIEVRETKKLYINEEKKIKVKKEELDKVLRSFNYEMFSLKKDIELYKEQVKNYCLIQKQYLEKRMNEEIETYTKLINKHNQNKEQIDIAKVED